jgi:hypothetical protein
MGKERQQRSVAVQLKRIGEQLGIKNRLLRYVVDHNLVPGLNGVGEGHFIPREFTTEEATLIALAALLHDHGFRGPAVPAILRRAKSQIRANRSNVTVDFKGVLPVTVKIPLQGLRPKLQRK